MTPETQNRHFDDYLRKSEVTIYIVLAVLLFITHTFAPLRPCPGRGPDALSEEPLSVL